MPKAIHIGLGGLSIGLMAIGLVEWSFLAAILSVSYGLYLLADVIY